MTPEERENATWVWHLQAHKGTGPVHWVGKEGWGLRPYSQAWCGQRPQFRHTVRPGTVEEVTCKTCLRRIKVGHPQSRAR